MIFIVISVHNRKEFTKNCLGSLVRQTFKDYEIIVVDDGSTDGTSEMIKNEFPGVHIENGDGNLWWAGATNTGIDYIFKNENPTSSDFILTLNNDLEVPEKYLEILANMAFRNPGSILGSLSVDISVPQKMNFCGIRWNKFTGKYHSKAKDYQNSYSELINDKEIIESDILPGRGTLIPIQAFLEIGKYDSRNFPQYGADEDFSLRAKKRGWKLLIPTQTYVMSHIQAMGADIRNARFSLKYYKYLFFSIRSPLNLRMRYRWAMKNAPLKFFYFLLDFTRIIISVGSRSFQNLLQRPSGKDILINRGSN